MQVAKAAALAILVATAVVAVGGQLRSSREHPRTEMMKQRQHRQGRGRWQDKDEREKLGCCSHWKSSRELLSLKG
jgi:hypothetical protein